MRKRGGKEAGMLVPYAELSRESSRMMEKKMRTK